MILFARISDRPGGLATLLTTLAQAGANLIEVEHVREGVDLHVRETGVQVVLEVRNRVAEELARRDSKDSLAPIDRDPVPSRYAESVRRYYENLGKE